MATSIIICGTTKELEQKGIVNIQKYGDVRVVDISGELTQQIIASVEAPLSEIHTIGRWKNTNNTYYPALITISRTGSLSASYFNGTSISAITNGTLVGTLTYVVGGGNT